MLSVGLLSELERVPLHAEPSRYKWNEVVERSTRMRSDLFAIEVSAGVEVALSGIFEARNVPDDLIEAYRLASPSVAADHTLHERYLEMVERGPESVTGFINNVKGKLAELRMPEHLEQEFPGYTFNLAESQNQVGWDLIGMSQDGGTDVLIQAKVGGANYAGDVLERMQDDPDLIFAASNEIRGAIVDRHPELAAQFVDLDLSNFEFTAGVEEKMSLLAENFGIDVPDSVGEVLPYVTEIILGIRLLYDIVKVERDFKTVAIDDKCRVHAMKALVLFQRFGVSAVCTTAGGAAGAPIVPPFGAIGGAVSGAVLSAYLNKNLRPHTMEVAMWLVRVTEDDIFYFNNKPAIDRIGSSLAQSATDAIRS